MIRNLMKAVVPPFIWTIFRKIKHLIDARFYTPSREEIEYLSRNKNGLAALFCLRPGLSFQIHPDCRMGFEYFCFRSPSMVAEMNSFLRITKGKKTFLDIGALHGVFSFAFAVSNVDSRVIAVDASPVAFSRLLYNIHKNEMRNLLALECAVSDKPGELLMQYEWEHLVAVKESKNAQVISVPMRTGDAICEEAHFSPEVIKIDVEGHEVNVLKGLADTIKKSTPIIFLEIHPERLSLAGESVSNLVDLIRELGYRTYEVSGGEIPVEKLMAYECDERFVLIKS